MPQMATCQGSITAKEVSKAAKQICAVKAFPAISLSSRFESRFSWKLNCETRLKRKGLNQKFNGPGGKCCNNLPLTIMLQGKNMGPKNMSY